MRTALERKQGRSCALNQTASSSPAVNFPYLKASVGSTSRFRTVEVSSPSRFSTVEDREKKFTEVVVTCDTGIR